MDKSQLLGEDETIQSMVYRLSERQSVHDIWNSFLHLLELLLLGYRGVIHRFWRLLHMVLYSQVSSEYGGLLCDRPNIQTGHPSHHESLGRNLANLHWHVFPLHVCDVALLRELW